MTEKADILTFGQGPVLGGETTKEIKTGSPSSTETLAESNGALNWWGNEIIYAGAELVKRNSRQSFRIMGGKTGPIGTDSEAELINLGMAQALQGEANPRRELEKRSTNTLENLVNICNDQLDVDGKKGEKSVDILGASFHLTRMKILMKLFDIPYRNVVGAKNMMEYAAREASNDAVLVDIQQRHDINAALRTPLSETEEKLDALAKGRGADLGYYAQRDDPELKTIVQKQDEEDLWTRALLTIPDYSLPYFAKIQNDDRLLAILHNFETNFFPETDSLGVHGISLKTDTSDEIRQKLSEIKRDMPDEAKRQEWIKENREKGFPDEVEKKLQHLLYPMTEL